MKSIFERLLIHCAGVCSGRVCRTGLPYMLHPLEVMNKVEALPDKIVALAHDYGELKNVEELAGIGVSDELIDKIKLLAKNFPDDVPEDDVRYENYFWNLLADRVCCEIKLADLSVNSGYEESPAGNRRRFTGRYPRVMQLLADAVDGKIYFNSRTLYVNIFSNFCGGKVDVNGKLWASGEHFYQAAKFAPGGLQEDPQAFFAVSNAHTPGEAKQLADEFLSESNKSRLHLALRTFIAMSVMLSAKFAPGTLARQRLMQTGKLELIHLSSDDLFWGQNRKGIGMNLLGKALMQIRNSDRDCSVVEMMCNAS